MIFRIMILNGVYDVKILNSYYILIIDKKHIKKSKGKGGKSADIAPVWYGHVI